MPIRLISFILFSKKTITLICIRNMFCTRNKITNKNYVFQLKRCFVFEINSTNSFSRQKDKPIKKFLGNIDYHLSIGTIFNFYIKLKNTFINHFIYIYYSYNFHILIDIAFIKFCNVVIIVNKWFTLKI